MCSHIIYIRVDIIKCKLCSCMQWKPHHSKLSNLKKLWGSEELCIVFKKFNCAYIILCCFIMFDMYNQRPWTDHTHGLDETSHYNTGRLFFVQHSICMYAQILELLCEKLVYKIFWSWLSIIFIHLWIKYMEE